MIRYRLVCGRGDEFEAWFRGSDDCDALAGAGQINCPLCGSTDVSKALMTPAVRSRKRRKTTPNQASEEQETAPITEGSDNLRLAGGSDPSVAEAMEAVRKLSKHIRENSEDVGRRFSEEARKIHYREVKPRSIIGDATMAEAKEMLDEGIEFHPLPVLPEERN